MSTSNAAMADSTDFSMSPSQLQLQARDNVSPNTSTPVSLHSSQLHSRFNGGGNPEPDRGNLGPNALPQDVHYPNVDHRGNRIVPFMGGGSPKPGEYPQAYGPASSSRRMSPIPPITPEKAQLRMEVEQLRESLQIQQQRAFHVIAHQQDGFQAHAQQFEQAARDVTQVEVARSEANVKAQYQSQLNQVEAVVQRTGQRLQDQQQKAAADQQKVRNEAQQALNDQRADLVGKAQEALGEQHQILERVATDRIAQQRDAIVHEANDALQHEQREHHENDRATC